MKKLTILFTLIIAALLSSAQSTILNINGELTLSQIDNYLNQVITKTDTIHVQTAGSDISGDGSVSYPYASLERAAQDLYNKKLDEDVEITILLGSGTFAGNLIAKSYLESVDLTSSGCHLWISGNFTELQNVTLSATSDPFVYNVLVGGVPPSWSVDEQRENIFSVSPYKYDRDHYPISTNTATTLETMPDLSSGVIKTLNTTLQLTDKLWLDINNITTTNTANTEKLSFFNLKIVSTVAIELSHDLGIHSCFIDPNGVFRNYGNINLTGSYIKGHTISNNKGLKFSKIVIYNENAYSEGTLNPTDLSLNIRGVIIDANSQYGIFAKNASVFNNNSIATGIAFKIKNASSAFRFIGSSFNSGVDEIIIENCDYFVKIESAPASLELPNLEQSIPNTAYVEGDLIFINSKNGIRLNIPETYPEINEGIKETLIDNSTTDIIVGDSVYNKSITIEYTATRGTSIEKNTVQITNKRTVVSVGEGILFGDDIGLSFGVAYNTEGKIELQCTLTSTGSNSEFKYNVQRIMY